jgi:hypothetical protein
MALVAYGNKAQLFLNLKLAYKMKPKTVTIMKHLAMLLLLGVCIHVTTVVKAQKMGLLVKILLPEDYELSKAQNNSLVFFSSVALGTNRNPMQNKGFRQIEIINNLDEILVIVHGTSEPCTVIHRNFASLKITFLTDSIRTSGFVWLRYGSSHGVHYKPNAPQNRATICYY